jgi:cytochrome b561
MAPVHGLLVKAMYTLLSIHVVAALWHDLAHRAGVNARMLTEPMRRALRQCA